MSIAHRIAALSSLTYNEYGMIETNGQIFVEAADIEAELTEILRLVEQDRQHVQIRRGGRPVADILPAESVDELPPISPEHRVKFSLEYDPVASLDPCDWPDDLR